MITFTTESSLSPLEAWSIWTAIGLHFNPERDYDAIKYKFKGPRCSREKFEAHKQRYIFEKLCKKYPKKNDYIGYCVSNILENKTWITDASDDIYTKWQGRIQALDYNFVSDINRWNEDMPEGYTFDTCILPNDLNELPFIYKQYKTNRMHIETLAILENLARYIDTCNNKLNDPMNISRDISHRVSRYAPFLVERMNVKKYTETITNLFTS